MQHIHTNTYNRPNAHIYINTNTHTNTCNHTGPYPVNVLSTAPLHKLVLCAWCRSSTTRFWNALLVLLQVRLLQCIVAQHRWAYEPLIQSAEGHWEGDVGQVPRSRKPPELAWSPWPRSENTAIINRNYFSDTFSIKSSTMVDILALIIGTVLQTLIQPNAIENLVTTNQGDNWLLIQTKLGHWSRVLLGSQRIKYFLDVMDQHKEHGKGKISLQGGLGQAVFPFSLR